MQAVGGQLIGRDVAADVAVGGGLGQQVIDEAGQVLVGLADVLAAVQERRQEAKLLAWLDQRGL